MTKRLTRSKNQRALFGLMGGIGEYFDTDPVLIRLLFLFVTIFTGVLPGIFAYLVGVILVPEAPAASTPVHDTQEV